MQRIILVDDGQEPIFQVDPLVEVGPALLLIVEFGAGMTNSDTQIISSEQLSIKRRHEQLGGADSHGIAHRQHQLHPLLDEAAAQAGFSFTHLFAGLTGIEHSNRDAMCCK